jgi:glycosyltransferase involved in cell wall biosynthesis
LEGLASQLGIRDRVIFPGRTDDVSKYLRSAHFCLLTSAFEGMSNAVLEAMSFGVVPLVSDVSGAKDIVDHGSSGFLFERDNLDDFVAKLELMRRMTATSYKAMSQAARESVRQRFGIDRIADQHLHVYRTLLDGTTFLRIPPGSRSKAALSSRRHRRPASEQTIVTRA